MLYTDDVAQLKHMGWPMDFIDFGSIMSDIRDAGAQGIFLDIVFRSVEHDREGFCEFFENISDISGVALPGSLSFDNCLEFNQYLVGMVTSQGEEFPGFPSAWSNHKNKPAALNSEGSIPVIVGGSLEYLDARKDYLDLINDQYDCKGVHSVCVKKVIKAFQNAIKAWPVTALLDQVASLAPVSIGAENGRSVHLTVGKKNHVGPAWLIAQHIESGIPGKEELTGEHNTPPVNRNLYVKWGDIVSKQQRKAIPFDRFGGCVQRGQLFFTRMVKLFAAQTFPNTSTAKDLIARCPYHLTINMHDYYAAVRTELLDNQPDVEITERFDFPVLKELLSDKFVLVGLAMNRFADHTESPVHGRIAGVYAHAMAVDNLLSYKQGFYRTDPQVSDEILGPHRRMLLLQYGLTFVMVLGLLLSFKKLKDGVACESSNRRWTCIGVVIMSAIALFWFFGLVDGILSHDGGWLDYALLLALLSAAIYTLFIYLGGHLLKKLKKILKKPVRRSINNYISSRRMGLCLFMPHVAIAFLALIILAALAATLSIWSRYDPFNFLYTFLSLLSLYFVLASSTISRGFTTFILNKDVAEEFFN